MKAGGIEPRETRLEKTTVKNQKNPVFHQGGVKTKTQS